MKGLMDSNETALEEKLRELALALPEGKHMQVVAIRPQVGTCDTNAGTVLAVLIADSSEDLARTSQVIRKGMLAAQETAGLADGMLRYRSSNGAEAEDASEAS